MRGGARSVRSVGHRTITSALSIVVVTLPHTAAAPLDRVVQLTSWLFLFHQTRL